MRFFRSSVLCIFMLISSNLVYVHADTGTQPSLTFTNNNTRIHIFPGPHNATLNPALTSGSNIPKFHNASPLQHIGETPGNTGYCNINANPCGNLTNVLHHGQVMHNAKILIVFWAGPGWTNCATSGYFDSPTISPSSTPSASDCHYMNLQVQFLKDMCSDPFMQIAAQYNDSNGAAGPCTVFSNPQNPYVDTRAFPHNPVLGSDLETEASQMLARMGLSTNINNQVYIFTPYNKDSCFDNAGGTCFSTVFCAYHASNGVLNYANMPDVFSAPTFGHGCGSPLPSPNSDPVADLEVSPLSHEAMESLTDPNVDAWKDYSNDQEIGDECAYDNLVTVNSDNSDIHLGIHGDPYYIQSEWSNSNNGCTLSEQSLPAPPSAPPTGIAASAISKSSIRLTWASSTGAASYNVFRSTSPTGSPYVLAGSPSTLSFTDTGLSSNTAYYYNLTASNTGGTSSISHTSISATTTLPPTISLSPNFGFPGTVINVTGKSFAPSSSLNVKYNGTIQSTTTTDVNGSFTITFSAPLSAVNHHLISATDGFNNTASTTFSIRNMMVVPNFALGGRMVTVTGIHMMPNSTIMVDYDGSLKQTVTSNSTGGFTATFSIPAKSRFGPHIVYGIDTSNHILSAVVTKTTPWGN